MADWYYARNGQHYGPMSIEALRERLATDGNLTEALIWREGFNDWRLAPEVADEILPQPVPDPSKTEPKSAHRNTRSMQPTTRLEAIRLTIQDFKKSLVIDDLELRRIILFLFGFYALGSGLFFAIHDYGKVNPIISFIAGCITGPLLLLISCGSLLAGGVIATALLLPLGDDRRAGDRMWIIGPVAFLIAGVIGAVSLYAMSRLPVIGRQISIFLNWHGN